MTIDRNRYVVARQWTFGKVPCALVSALLLVACTLEHRSVGAQRLTIAPCGTAEQIAASTSVDNVGPAEAGFEIAAESAGVARLESISRLTGPCTDSLERFGMGTVMVLKSGALVIKGRKVQPSDGTNGEGYFTNQPVFSSLPSLPDYSGRFVAGIEIVAATQPSNQSDFRHLGIWQVRSQYVVVAFQLNEGGRIGKAIPLLKSRSNLAGLTYFPAPDGRGGNIGILAKDRREAYVASIRWSGIM